MNLSQAYAIYLPWIETEMQAVLRSRDSSLAGHYGIMGYHMGWLDADMNPVDTPPAGKRIRPLLCLLACAAAGGDPSQAVPAAAGLELLHNFSLIHDDIEDDSPIRRHRPTAWKLFGMPLACNAGDGMFSAAHLALHRLSERGVPASTVLAAFKIFDETCVALTEGQFLDISFEARLAVSTGEYFAMIRGKTGALLAAAPQIGALVAGVALDLVAIYRQFGTALGQAFQLQDDILGVWGDEAVTGKSAASDILDKKKSLPVLYALSHPTVGAKLRELYAGSAFTQADVPGILALLEAAGARAYVEARVQEAVEAARRALRAAEPRAVPGPHAALGELLESLASRRA